LNILYSFEIYHNVIILHFNRFIETNYKVLTLTLFITLKSFKTKHYVMSFKLFKNLAYNINKFFNLIFFPGLFIKIFQEYFKNKQSPRRRPWLLLSCLHLVMSLWLHPTYSGHESNNINHYSSICMSVYNIQIYSLSCYPNFWTNIVLKGLFKG
jgi:hypothetical protein